MLLALLFTWSKTLEALMLPLLVTLNMIPKVALGPLIIVWFKYGVFPNTMMAFSIAVFPILLTTARGLREVEPDLLDLVRSLRGSRWQLFTKIQLPGALPYVFAGMKVAAILAVAGAIVGEFLGSDRGLGYLMLQVQVTLDTPAMFMAVILITLLGMLLYGLVLLLEKLFVRRCASVVMPSAAARRKAAPAWAAGAQRLGCPHDEASSICRRHQDLQAGRKQHLAISDASFDVMPGELVSLVGPSGCGKSDAAQGPRGAAPARRRHGAHRLGGNTRSTRRATSAWCSSSRCC